MLNIENEEEVRVAQEAVEQFRKTRIRHVGLHAKRMEYPCEQSTRERAFAEGWAKENAGHWSGNKLESLLTTEPCGNRVIRKLTPEEATAAATVIQWLGTNVGWCFLCECIKAAGYSEPRKGPAQPPDGGGASNIKVSE